MRRSRPGGNLNVPIDMDMVRKALRTRPALIGRLEGCKPPITRVLPQPRVVQLGEAQFVVNELQLDDLAALQQWVEEQVPDPLAEIPHPLADRQPETRRERLLAAVQGLTGKPPWPPRYGTPEASRLLLSPLGMGYFLLVMLRKHQPELGLVQALELMPLITIEQWAELRRIGHGVSRLQELLWELEPSRDDPFTITDWWESANLVNEHRHYTYAEMGSMYLSQWRCLHACGKYREPDPSAPKRRQPKGDSNGTT